MRIHHSSFELGDSFVTSSSSNQYNIRRLVIWDEQSSKSQQVLEMKLQLRLSRIEEECAKFRKPSRSKASRRSAPVTTSLPLDTNRVGEELSQRQHCSGSVTRVTERLRGRRSENDRFQHADDGCAVVVDNKTDSHISPLRTSHFPREETQLFRLPTDKPILTENTN